MASTRSTSASGAKASRRRASTSGHSAYATTFYRITSFHGLHVTTGVIYLTVMTIRTAMGKYDGGNHNHIEILGLFWHFVDLVWILVFTFVYLL